MSICSWVAGLMGLGFGGSSLDSGRLWGPCAFWASGALQGIGVVSDLFSAPVARSRESSLNPEP